VEKLFFTEIGLNAAAVGLVSAAYAAVVPFLEVPSGLLADRWSRRGVLMLASVALSLSALLGGLSHGVGGSLLSAVALGVFFALYSGTLDALLYDTVLAETGSGGRFEREIGRVRLMESAALVVSALAGGWLAAELSTRATYFLTVPFGLLAVLAYRRFREPGLHRVEARPSVRTQLADTLRALTTTRRLLPVVALSVLTALLLQVLLEFGPLWLVALAVPAVLYGPYWAVLTSTLGLGGALAGRIRLDRRGPAAGFAALLVVAGTVPALPVGAGVAVAAQVVLALQVVVAGIHVTRLLHEGVPSAVRAGVASGVSTLSWLAFVPFALLFGVVSTTHGVTAAGGMITVTAVLAAALLLAAAWRRWSPRRANGDLTIEQG
jgi:MFS family permease